MGIYDRLIEEPTVKRETKAFVPQIEEIRVIIGEDGEEYINSKDMTVAMEMIAFNSTPTMSVLAFIRRFTIELITARR
ncbi:MAG: hypothetical protein DRI97_04610 [Bacteroidetes bacterium]|nr:MAG: hypothetical protein DRI97_04610 [Bacteroidota bacterium]